MTQVVSSISGLQVYAPSAGFAPTNSADVSAIASGYQVVSATATQLYAGTAYLTSVNETPVSASRAGQAANASLANSAYYDGTGRLISALPDSAAVSAIASAYVSGKADSSSLGSYALSADVSGVIDTVSANSASWSGGGVEESAVSAIASSYAESAEAKCWPISGNGVIYTTGDGFQIHHGNDDFYVGPLTAYNGASLYFNKGGYPSGNFGISNRSVYGGNTASTSYYYLLTKSGLSGRYYDAGAKEWKYTKDEYDNLTSVTDTVSANSATWGQGGVDSATVSSIASSYAESAASSKLDSSAIGTAEWMMVPMVTSISGTQISAITAAHADGADSAHTDADGRYLTALAAESSLSSKLDASASSSFYTTANESGFITGVDLTPYQTTAGMTAYQPAGDYQPSGDYYSASNPSGFVDSAYVDSAVSGKQDALTFDYDADSAISAINGSALAGQGGGASIPFYGNYWDSSTSATAAITADVSSVRSVAYFKYDGSFVNTYSGITDTLGNTHLGVASFIAPGAEINYGKSIYTLVFAPATSMWTTADAATGIFAPLQYGSGAGMFLNNGSYKGYLKGNEWFVANTPYGYARGEVHKTRGCQVIVEHTGGAVAALSARNNTANVTLNNTAYGTARMAVSTNQAYVQVQRGNSASKYNSAKLDTDYLKFYNGMATGYLDPEDTASGTAYLPPETEYMYISSIPYWNGKADGSALSSYVPYSSLEYNTASAISGINGSALAAGSTYSAGEGIDITDDVISVETPVDIVAGPGIVIDNPDGNTLRVSMADDYEVTLFEVAAGSPGVTTATISEDLTNFERVRFTVYRAEGSGLETQRIFEFPSVTTKFDMDAEMFNENGTYRALYLSRYEVSDLTVTNTIAKHYYAAVSSNGYSGNGNEPLRLLKIVGVHRIAGGN